MDPEDSHASLATGGLAEELSKYLAAEAADDAEQSAEVLGGRFESWPCRFLAEAERARLAPERIADLIAATPPEYVDRACDRAEKLERRSRKIVALRDRFDGIDAIHAPLERRLRTLTRACESTPGANVGPEPVGELLADGWRTDGASVHLGGCVIWNHHGMLFGPCDDSASAMPILDGSTLSQEAMRALYSAAGRAQFSEDRRLYAEVCGTYHVREPDDRREHRDQWLVLDGYSTAAVDVAASGARCD